jgi:hypothetical protein
MEHGYSVWIGQREFIVGADGFEDEAGARGSAELTPEEGMLGWGMVEGVVETPVYAGGFGVSGIRDVIHMSLFSPLISIHFFSPLISIYSFSPSPPLPTHPLSPSIIRKQEENTILSISPQTTPCLNNPASFLPVKNPSLPATSSLHSSPNILKIPPAFSVCDSESPKRTHFPILFLVSESQREALAVCAGGGGEDGASHFREEVEKLARQRLADDEGT